MTQNEKLKNFLKFIDNKRDKFWKEGNMEIALELVTIRGYAEGLFNGEDKQ